MLAGSIPALAVYCTTTVIVVAVAANDCTLATGADSSVLASKASKQRVGSMARLLPPATRRDQCAAGGNPCQAPAQNLLLATARPRPAPERMVSRAHPDRHPGPRQGPQVRAPRPRAPAHRPLQRGPA